MNKHLFRAKRACFRQFTSYRPFYSRNLERVLYPHRTQLHGDAFIPKRFFRRLTRSFPVDR